jgi:hypothetical protein
MPTSASSGIPLARRQIVNKNTYHTRALEANEESKNPEPNRK